MQCDFSGTKEDVSMETSTHGGRERGRREREQQLRVDPLAKEEQPPDPYTVTDRSDYLFVYLFVLIDFPLEM